LPSKEASRSAHSSGHSIPCSIPSHANETSLLAYHPLEPTQHDHRCTSHDTVSSHRLVAREVLLYLVGAVQYFPLEMSIQDCLDSPVVLRYAVRRHRVPKGKDIERGEGK